MNCKPSGANWSIAIFLAFGCALAGGCKPNSSAAPATVATGTAASAGNDQSQYRKELLQSALSLLNTPEQYDDELQFSLLIVERLNQWRRAGQLAGDAKSDNGEDDASKTGARAGNAAQAERDPLIDTLPKELADMRLLRRLNVDAFDPSYDGLFLRETTMLRDVAGHVDSETLDDLAVASALFDWTVRNIQLEPQPAKDAPPEEQWLAYHLPMDTIFFGRGTPLQRAWVFMLLTRQAGLDVVLLATPEPRSPDTLRPWATALISGGELYLFDYTYGLPIPGPGGKGIATLSQAAADDSILRQMDVPGDRVYPKKAADIEKVTALLEASPGYLERRMKTFESQLSGHDRMVLSNSPSVTAAKLRDIKHVGDVKLWSQPYEILQARSTAPSELLRAAQLERMPFTIAADPEESGKKKDDTRRNERRLQALKLARLLQLRGMYGVSASDRTKNQQPTELSEAAERGAKYYYLRALPQQEQLEAVARAERLGEEIAPGRRLTKEFVDAYQRVRDDAAYWLGLVWLEQKAYQSADPYFDKMTLQANPDGPWANGARYNLARSYEAQGKLPEAIKLYQADRSPQRYGNRLRAERLKEQTAEKKPEKADAKKTDMKKK